MTGLTSDATSKSQPVRTPLLDPPMQVLAKPHIYTIVLSVVDDTMMKIHFSLSDGIIMVYPQPKAPKSGTGKHRTNYSLQSRSTASTSPRKDTKQPLPPIETKVSFTMARSKKKNTRMMKPKKSNRHNQTKESVKRISMY